MTKDPKQKADQRQNGARSIHDDALGAISQKVDEKLSQIASGSYDEEMERHLNEIQELRRQEKEELERRRSERRSKRQKGRGASKSEDRAQKAEAETKFGAEARIKDGSKAGAPASGEKMEHMRSEEDIKRWTESLNAELRGISASGKGDLPAADKKVAPWKTRDTATEEGRSAKASGSAAQEPKEEERNTVSFTPPWKEHKQKSVYPTQEELEVKSAKKQKKAGKAQEAEASASEKIGHVSIAELARQAVEEAEAEKRRIAAEKEAAMTEFAKKSEREAAAVVERERARFEAEKARAHLTEEERMAQAVDRFFDAAEEIASEENDESIFAKLKNWFDRLAAPGGKNKKHGSGRNNGGPGAETPGTADSSPDSGGSSKSSEPAVSRRPGKPRENKSGNGGPDNSTERIEALKPSQISGKAETGISPDKIEADTKRGSREELVRAVGGQEKPGGADYSREELSHPDVGKEEPDEADSGSGPGGIADRFPEQVLSARTDEPSQEPDPEHEPSRKLDESIDGFLHGVKSCVAKTVHISKELHLTRRDMEEESHLTHEKRMARYRAVWAKHLRPMTKKLDTAGSWTAIKAAQVSSWGSEKRANCGVRASLFGAKAKAWAERAYVRSLTALEYAEHHKMKLFRWFAGAVVCAMAVGIAVGHMTAYEYMYNGRVLGIVKNQEVVYKTIDVIGSKLAESLGADIEIDKETDITFRKVIGLNLPVDGKDDVLNSLTYMRTLKAKGYAIVADNKQIAVLQSKEAAQSILEQFKEQFAQQKEGVEYKSVTFAQDVKVKEIDTQLGNLQNADEAMRFMLTGAVEKKIHEVQKGQTFNAIAKSYGLSPSELQASNTGVQPDKLKIGQELVLTQDSPVLTVQTKEIARYTAEIPFEIVYEDTGSKYKGEKSVKLQGQKGQKEVEAEIVRSNGVEVSRKELSVNVISEPVNQVVLVGTKEKPKTVATGSFSYPVRGARLSSRYGRRWGRTHQGIDLAIAKGTTISASDGGTVTFAGYKGSYGYLVIINHGNGKETYYAHCSKLLVSRGAKVYKGQAIAKVGSTGNSTGPHVHFEVHVNGVPKNPMNYL